VEGPAGGAPGIGADFVIQLDRSISFGQSRERERIVPPSSATKTHTSTDLAAPNSVGKSIVMLAGSVRQARGASRVAQLSRTLSSTARDASRCANKAIAAIADVVLKINSPTHAAMGTGTRQLVI
jgi:hypothetical protein